MAPLYAVGVPEMKPVVGLIDNPAGNTGGETILYTYGVVPPAALIGLKLSATPCVRLRELISNV